MTQSQQKIQLGTVTAKFDGETLSFANSVGHDLSFTREQIMLLFDFLSKFTHQELNRRECFRVPILDPDRIQVRVGIEMKLVDATPLDISYKGIMVRIDGTGVELPIGSQSTLRIGYEGSHFQTEAHLRRQQNSILAFEFIESALARDKGAPALLNRIVQAMQRDWLASSFRNRST